ncbi:phosphonate ABC transporter ATP-binding protein [Paracoccus sp. (in: a-proteobacteria)]|uniref:phosphonate ABC transporter ATP-binding protein n=1 Tax=Paracoccus sp. TaxID=267 RepID=UPI0026DFED64|nr:phosphonate ABC transporter ATP-binding protein [Paracoccus sp. (in: a-proteobacteria)]MDO5646486.1 phosphonate ABC transporter ATP-binding protein [Paracoccus sp. (in: a-proteobacteria)]
MRVQVQNVAKTYPDGTQVLHDVSFDIPSGQGVALLGANGCGKSTLLRCILGLEPVTRGAILLDGTDITQARGRKLRLLRTDIGSVFQQFNLVGNLSVHQNVLFGRMGAHGFWRSLSITAPADARDRAMACLDRVGLAHLAARRTDTLSGGQQQRVAIARMLMQDAKIVFADEPVASLDPKAGREVMDLLFEIVQERNLTVVCVLHQLDLARHYAGRIIGLKQGRVALDGAPDSLTDDQLADLYQGAPTTQDAA